MDRGTCRPRRSWSTNSTPSSPSVRRDDHETEEWLDYLSTARKFHRYSPQNQLLLALQGAEGYVAGYRNWQRIPRPRWRHLPGRQGRSRAQDPRPDDRQDRRGRRRHRRGDHPKPPPRIPHRQGLPPRPTRRAARPSATPSCPNSSPARTAGNTSGPPSPVDSKTTATTSTLHSRSPIETWNGHDDVGRHVSVRSPTTSNRRNDSRHCCTNGHTSNSATTPAPTSPDAVKEVEAESVAYLLSQTIGLDSDAYSVPYIAGLVRRRHRHSSSPPPRQC